jgi:hypothetical protein
MVFVWFYDFLIATVQVNVAVTLFRLLFAAQDVGAAHRPTGLMFFVAYQSLHKTP